MTYWLKLFGAAAIMAMIAVGISHHIIRQNPRHYYDTIKPGMTLNEVEAILGKPDSSPCILGGGYNSYTWELYDYLITIKFSSSDLEVLEKSIEKSNSSVLIRVLSKLSD